MIEAPAHPGIFVAVGPEMAVFVARVTGPADGGYL